LQPRALEAKRDAGAATPAKYFFILEEVEHMVYPYMTLADNTEIVHTQVFEEDGIQKVEVHFERPTDNGFDTAR
jgi:hypothetical protein